MVYRQSYSAYNRLTSHAHRLARSSQPTLAVAREPSFKEDRARLKRATRQPMPSLLTNSATNSARPPIYADSAPPSSMVRRSSGVVSAGSSSGTLPSESHSFPCNEEAEGACAPPKFSGKACFKLCLQPIHHQPLHQSLRLPRKRRRCRRRSSRNPRSRGARRKALDHSHIFGCWFL